MSKTVDELCDVFGQASGAEYERWLYDQRNDHVTLAAGPALAMRRAGIAAVIRALRDEMQFGDWTAWHRLNEILGDAGEKVAECSSVTLSPAPATDPCPRCGYPAQDQCDSPECNIDPAPAVCVWNTDDDVYRSWVPACCTTRRHHPAYTRVICPACKRPIKFTEAK